ncbi:hypothetical protein RRG08_018951 [Elysia crispata]|uniref:Uncharacterized protein n=1 Tax=Elysia crispata TaxID=231223 RepID=A0AAE1A4Y0_9GAST|nr:hypothetical protein RRG08_018951 [Elysia crispata]
MLSTSLGPVFALVMAAVLTSAGDAAESALKLDVIVSALPSSTVSINCSFDPSLASMKTVNELKVFGSKPNSKKQDFQSFASVDRWNPDPILFSGAGRDGVDLIGSFGFESDISELALSWASPSLTSGLRYKCAAQGTDHNGQIVTISETTKIDDTTVEFSSLAKDMSLLSDYVKKTLNDIQRDLNAVKNKVNSNVDDISDLQNAVDTSVNTSKQMAKKLTTVPLKTDFSKLKDRVDQMDKLVSDHSKSIVLLSAMRDFHLSLTFQDTVYMASKYESYFDFSDADSQCEAIGGYLAEINTFTPIPRPQPRSSALSTVVVSAYLCFSSVPQTLSGPTFHFQLEPRVQLPKVFWSNLSGATSWPDGLPISKCPPLEQSPPRKGKILILWLALNPD